MPEMIKSLPPQNRKLLFFFHGNFHLCGFLELINIILWQKTDNKFVSLVLKLKDFPLEYVAVSALWSQLMEMKTLDGFWGKQAVDWKVDLEDVCSVKPGIEPTLCLNKRTYLTVKHGSGSAMLWGLQDWHNLLHLLEPWILLSRRKT